MDAVGYTCWPLMGLSTIAELLEINPSSLSSLKGYYDFRDDGFFLRLEAVAVQLERP